MPTDLSSVPSSATAPARAATAAAPVRSDGSAAPPADPDILRALESLHGDGVDA